MLSQTGVRGQLPGVRGQLPGVRGQLPGVRGQLPGVRGQLRAQLRPVVGHWSNMSDALKPIRR
jgi:hypothetical protein